MTNKLEEIKEYDKKFKLSSSIKVDAYCMNISESQLIIHIEDAHIAEDDIIIIETQSKGKFIF